MASEPLKIKKRGEDGTMSCLSMGTVLFDNKRKDQSVNENRPC